MKLHAGQRVKVNLNNLDPEDSYGLPQSLFQGGKKIVIVEPEHRKTKYLKTIKVAKVNVYHRDDFLRERWPEEWYVPWTCIIPIDEGVKRKRRRDTVVTNGVIKHVRSR